MYIPQPDCVVAAGTGQHALARARARRASDEGVFMLMGRVVEHSATERMFVAPQKQETSDYIEGRFG